MTQYQSDKLKVISFASILLVLYIHSGFHDYPNEIQGMVFNHYLQESISGGLGQCAVPMFFAISGFLFFRGINSLHDVYAKMKKRVRTILIPFIIAAWFLPLFYIAIESIPAASRYINAGGITDVFKNESVWYIFQALYIHVPGEPNPWGFHLWFMQDLIGIILLSPLLFYARKALGDYKFIGGGILLILSLLEILFLPIRSACWFMLGDLFLAANNDELPKWLQRASRPRIILPLFVVLVVVQMFGRVDTMVFNTITIVCGLVALWKSYDSIIPSTFLLKNHKWMTLTCGYTFFIYLYHEPTLNIVRKLLVIPFGHSSFSFALSYLLSPWIFAAIGIGVGIVFKRLIPKVYEVCVGGR